MADARGRDLANVPLNRDEIALLNAVANGHTRKEIAAIRGVSVGTIQNMMRIAESKLCARTTEHAIAIATRTGVV